MKIRPAILSVFCLSCLIVCLSASPLLAATFSPEDIYRTMEQVVEKGKRDASLKLKIKEYEPGIEEHTYQSAKTIVVQAFVSGDYWFPFIQTRDSAIIFPANIRVGRSLQDVLKSQAIPGEKLPVQKKGAFHVHSWKVGEGVFTLNVKGDTITEITYSEPYFVGIK